MSSSKPHLILVSTGNSHLSPKIFLLNSLVLEAYNGMKLWELYFILQLIITCREVYVSFLNGLDDCMIVVSHLGYQ